MFTIIIIREKTCGLRQPNFMLNTNSQLSWIRTGFDILLMCDTDLIKNEACPVQCIAVNPKRGRCLEIIFFVPHSFGCSDWAGILIT